jgi:cytochrome c peroxidase
VRASAIALLFLLLPLGAGAEEWQWRLPPGVGAPPVPADNPMTRAKVELGRRLFFDPRLSGNGTMSCASCHFPDRAFTDGRRTSPGSTGEMTDRNAPMLVNLAWNATYTWANPALTTLERQAEVPLFSETPVEMGVNDANRAEVIGRFKIDHEMARAFAAAFPDLPEPVGLVSIIKALASFQRSLLSFDSRFDQGRLNEQERRGHGVFSRQCARCHGGPVLAQPPVGFVAIMPPEAYVFPNRGLYEFTGETADLGRVRPPLLRNVALTAPYLHDGRAATLDDALSAHRTIRLAPAERSEVIAFLHALTDPAFAP